MLGTKPLHSRDPVTDFRAISRTTARRAFAAQRAYFSPVYIGLDKVDVQRPAMWVCNHTLYGLADAMLMCAHLYDQHGVLLRGLADRMHFNVPGWGHLIAKLGGVVASPENCSRLMQAGEHVLVYPGGAREVNRHKGEKHSLIWKQRTGFARLAIQHGYDIIPVAALGADDAWDILIDNEQIRNTRLWKGVARLVPLDEMTRQGEGVPPLARGLGLTALPRPQRLYFAFGQRIRTRRHAGKAEDKEVQWALRERVAAVIERQIKALQAYRATDRRENWSPLRRWLAPVR